MADTEVREGESDYARLFAKWEVNGKSATFEEYGEHGGRMWRVLNRDTTPVFLLHAAAGPTDPGHDKAIWAPTSGYEVEMADTGLRLTEGPGGPGDLRLSMRRFPRDVTI